MFFFYSSVLLIRRSDSEWMQIVSWNGLDFCLIIDEYFKTHFSCNEISIENLKHK